MLRMLVAKPRRNQHLDRVAEQLGQSVAEELFGLRLDLRDAFFFNDTPPPEICPLSLHDALPICPFTFADIADRAGDERALLGFERAQADLDGEFRAVFAPAVKLQPGAHRAHFGIGEIAVAMVRMLVAKPRRNQHLDRVAEQLVASVAEELLGLRIDQRDAAVATDDHHSVRRRFEQRAKLVVRFDDMRWRSQKCAIPLSRVRHGGYWLTRHGCHFLVLLRSLRYQYTANTI